MTADALAAGGQVGCPDGAGGGGQASAQRRAWKEGRTCPVSKGLESRQAGGRRLTRRPRLHPPGGHRTSARGLASWKHPATVSPGNAHPAAPQRPLLLMPLLWRGSPRPRNGPSRVPLPTRLARCVAVHTTSVSLRSAPTGKAPRLSGVTPASTHTPAATLPRDPAVPTEQAREAPWGLPASSAPQAPGPKEGRHAQGAATCHEGRVGSSRGNSMTVRRQGRGSAHRLHHKAGHLAQARCPPPTGPRGPQARTPPGHCKDALAHVDLLSEWHPGFKNK